MSNVETDLLDLRAAFKRVRGKRDLYYKRQAEAERLLISAMTAIDSSDEDLKNNVKAKINTFLDAG